jgi:hemolysin activation/secretion protein
VALLLNQVTISFALAQEEQSTSAIPSFEELEAAGSIIGEIRINNQNIFDLDNPKEDNALFRFANKFHIRTRPAVLRRSLTFQSGEPLSVRKIEESERLLRNNRYIYDVIIRPIAYQNGVVDIEVATRDTWSLEPGISFSRTGGSNSTGISFREFNLFGTGISLGVTRKSNIDRTGTEAFIAHTHAFDGWTILDYRQGNYDSGKTRSVMIDRPFYALDTRWAAGASAYREEFVVPTYSGGNIVNQYVRKSRSDAIYGGLSKGLVEGWAHRYSIGLRYLDYRYFSMADGTTTTPLPEDQQLVVPFVRYQLVEDDFEKLSNRDRVAKTEYFALGWQSTIEIGRATQALDSNRDLWMYSAAFSDGFRFEGGHNLLLSASTSGLYGEPGGENQTLGASARYYRQQSSRGLFFASASFDTITNGDASNQLLLGGDNGLRGYPLRYQTGTHRALFSIEQRAYTTWFPFRLFRVGGAAFFDVGRAWEGANQNTANPGWLSDVGFGLRIFSDRVAFGNVLHIDIAIPLNPDPAIASYQFLVKTKTSF